MKIPDPAEIFSELHAIGSTGRLFRNFHTSRGKTLFPCQDIMILSPSLLSADFACLGEEVSALESAGLPWLHLDVMDGSFVPNITFGPPIIQRLRQISRLFFDVHLMIEEPSRYVGSFCEAGADLLVIHAEADRHPQRTLSLIRSMGCKAGLALSPATDVSILRWLAADMDLVLLMGVNPGFSGQKFLPASFAKIRSARAMLDAHGGSAVPIQMDGGACPENAAQLVAAGADILVSGSAFFSYKPYAQRHRAFLQPLAGLAARPAEKVAARWQSRHA